jgi:hypothetical protein
MSARKMLVLVLLILVGTNLAAQKKSNPTLPIILNVIPGFGTGSALQNDSIGKNTCVLTDSISVATIGIGGLVLGFEFLGFYMKSMGSEAQPNISIKGDFSIGLDILYAGLVIYGISKSLGIVFPIIYSNNENKLSFGFDATKESYNGNGIDVGIKVRVKLD